MKYLFILFICSSALFACTGNDAKSAAVNKDSLQKVANDTANYTSIQWLDSLHQDLGKVNEGQILEVTWRFKNTGAKPLIITNASASCGCTVAEKPEAPIAPGAESEIKAKFDSHGRENMQTKQVFVEANTTGSRSQALSFSVDV